ncbi:MAG: hypothetical protein V7750_06460 [Sneathiella sp.]
MIKEHRELVFSNEDLIEAIQVFPNKNSLKIPDGTITGITVMDDAYVFAVVQVTRADDSKTEDVALDATILAALMLYYCKANKIPIPRNAEKKITKVDTGISLSIRLS